jgi:hypothetical protein
MQLMIRDDKDVAANDMSSGLPIKSNIVQFLNAAKGESSLFVLKQVRNNVTEALLSDTDRR